MSDEVTDSLESNLWDAGFGTASKVEKKIHRPGSQTQDPHYFPRVPKSGEKTLDPDFGAQKKNKYIYVFEIINGLLITDFTQPRARIL